MADFRLDTSDLDRLRYLLDRAGDRIDNKAADEVRDVTSRIAAEARSTAAGYPHGTGALAAAVDYEVSGLESRVFANVREAFYLEYGSPNTGAPRPWLTEPTERGMRDLEDKLGKAGAPW